MNPYPFDKTGNIPALENAMVELRWFEVFPVFAGFHFLGNFNALGGILKRIGNAVAVRYEAGQHHAHRRGLKNLPDGCSGRLCPGTNDFGENCKNCRYVPFVVRKILQRQENFVFGQKPM